MRGVLAVTRGLLAVTSRLHAVWDCRWSGVRVNVRFHWVPGRSVGMVKSRGGAKQATREESVLAPGWPSTSSLCSSLR